MAVLSDAKRAECNAELMREVSQQSESFGALTKADLLAAVNAIDQFLHDNAATINTAIPQPARGALTTAQKSRLMRLVMRKRFEEGT